MTAAEAHAAATAEGLALVRAENSSGFKGVFRPSRKSSTSKPFEAQLTHGGRQKYLGTFATAEEAALAVARALGPAGVAAALAPEPASMTAAEAHAAAEAWRQGRDYLLARDLCSDAAAADLRRVAALGDGAAGAEFLLAFAHYNALDAS